jgi:hypothetical protein
MDSDKSATAVLLLFSVTGHFPGTVAHGETATLGAASVPGVLIEARMTRPDGTAVELPPAAADDEGNIRLMWDTSFLTDVSFGFWFINWRASYEGTPLKGGGKRFSLEPSLTRIDSDAIQLGLGYGYVGAIVPGSDLTFYVQSEEGTSVELALYHDYDPSMAGYERASYEFGSKVVSATGEVSWTWRIPSDVALGQ